MSTFTKMLSIGILMIPHFCGAQAPTLGSTAGFALYTSVGAVTNTASSQITGNVGTNNGAITGFGNVNGVMHENDGATLAAVTDLQNLYTQLDTISATDTIAPLLGNGDTLTSGVYAISGNSTLGLVLNLDAQGAQNAVFILKITGTLSAGVLSQVQLLNGAQACNVFWKVEGMVSLATGAKLKGTILANNAAIDMAADVSLEGRALSTAGAISINDVLVYTPPGCGSPILNGPATPNLASTACYALFTGNGSNTNAGISVVEGDAGTNVGLTAGYDTLLVNGTVHPIPDTSTATCAADLINVSTYLNALPADIELLYPAQFGNSLKLTPHTYLLNAATALNDTLFLDAMGNPNGVFVIKINGALSTGTFATVVLMNGALAQNVFWQVNGAVAINSFSIFKGTIVSNNGAIDLGVGSQIVGRALTTDGAFTANQVNIALPTPCNNNIVLANDWLYFNGKSRFSDVVLEWGTTGSTTNGTFHLERSADGSRFEQLQSVPAVSGNTEHHYTVTDPYPLQKAYYRISLTTAEHQANYFRTIEVNSNGTAKGTEMLYPNPWKNELNIRSDASLSNPSQLNMYNVVGVKVYSHTLTAPQTKLHVVLSGGIYYYTLTAANGKVLAGKVTAE